MEEPQQQQQQHQQHLQSLHEEGGRGGCSDSLQQQSTSLPMDSGSGEVDQYYPRPIVIVDLIWNLAFVMVAMVVLLASIMERPSTPLRIWVSGYALQCLLHVLFVYLEYLRKKKKKNRMMMMMPVSTDHAADHGLSPSQGHSRIVKRLESVNTMMSSIWWVVGFYWIVVGGQALLQDSPRLYWLTVVFLAFDVFFIIFCIGMACVIFFFLFFCIPLMAVAYAVATRQGASEDDIRNLPRYMYRQTRSSTTLDDNEKQEAEASGGWGVNLSDGTSSTSELALHPDDSECCICLSQYVDGAELYTLPCNHHFHGGCISKWLRINATCPLCKFNIRRGDTLV